MNYFLTFAINNTSDVLTTSSNLHFFPSFFSGKFIRFDYFLLGNKKCNELIRSKLRKVTLLQFMTKRDKEREKELGIHFMGVRLLITPTLNTTIHIFPLKITLWYKKYSLAKENLPNVWSMNNLNISLSFILLHASVLSAWQELIFCSLKAVKQAFSRKDWMSRSL